MRIQMRLKRLTNMGKRLMNIQQVILVVVVDN